MNDGLNPCTSCMSAAGIPVQPYFVLGGFIPDGTKGFPDEPDYNRATAVVITFILDNYNLDM